MSKATAGITEVSIAETIGQMEALYAANVGMMVISLPGIGKTEMISQEALRILESDLGSKKKAQEAFFIVDMSGIPSESLAVPYINPEASPAQLKMEYLKALSNPDTPEDLKEVAKAELDKLMAKDEEDIRRLQRDVIGEIRDAKAWMKTNPGKKCIVFIDEITSANQDDQRTLMNFIQSGISPDGSRMNLNNIWFILAGNPSAEMPGYEDYDGATNPIEEAVITRVATFFVKADVESVLQWGMQTGEDGNANIHPYLISALETDRKLYMNRVETDIRLMNSRTLFKLSEYFKASTRIGKRWNAITVKALVGDSTGTALCNIIEKLDKLVSIKELFGSSKSDKLNPEGLAKFKGLQEFEKYYILSSALDESSPLNMTTNDMKKIAQLLEEGGCPQETVSTLAKRIIAAPAGTKLRKLTSSKALLNGDTNLLQKLHNIRSFTTGTAFQS